MTLQETADGTRHRVLLGAALAGLTVVLYGWRLADAPLHLHYDEIFFGLQAHSIQTTGHDLNGRLMPIYFQLENTFNWYQPIAVYWSALVLAVLPLSDATIRFPTVLVAAVNVVLLFLVAHRLTSSLVWAVAAALLLMLTPAHFIHARLAMDYVYPLPFFLSWLLCLLRYDQTASPRTLLAAGLALGVGAFSYIAATALAPLFLLATLTLVAWRRRPWSHLVAASAGFAVPLIAAVLFVAVYPDAVPDLLQKYGFGAEAAPTPNLDVMQRLREAINTRTVSDGLNHYWRFFSPGYLFVTGGSNLTNSTRTSGVFAPAMALLLLVGILDVIKRPTASSVVLLFGFLAAVVPAAAVPEDYTIDRHMVMVPFAVLLAVNGARTLWDLPLERPVRRLTTPLGIGLAVIALAYGAWSLVRRGELSGSAPLLLGLAIAIVALGVVLQRMRSWRPIAAAALLMIPVTFAPFVTDYFGGYLLRSSGWFGGNLRGAIEMAIRAADEQQAPAIQLSRDIPYVQSYWRFYLAMFARTELAAKTLTFDQQSFDAGSLAPGSVLLFAGDDPVAGGLVARGMIEPVAAASDIGDGRDHFTIYRATGPPPR